MRRPERGRSRPLRIGLYGAIANNLYCLAKLLNRHGHDAVYIRDSSDNYPMSQPVWEDVGLTFDPTRLEQAPPTVEEWRELERDVGWERPRWVVERGGHGVSRWTKLARAARLAPVLDPRLYKQLRWYAGWNAPVIEQLRACDWAITTGPDIIAARLSGTPYLYLPFGGDVTVMPDRGETPLDRFLGRGIRAAVRTAAAAGSADPAMNLRLRELGYPREPGWYQFLVDTDRYRPRADEPLDPLAENVIDLARGRITLLMCSRQDFEWKGSDRFLAAFVRAVRGAAELFLVLTPWGRDLQRAQRLLLDAGLDDSFHVLPGLPSKPLLRHLIWASDVVVDQFVLGAFGTAALEAMACGRPVLMHVDEALFADRPAEYSLPPVLQAATEDEIARVLLRLTSREIEPAAAGRRAREWVDTYHGPQHLPKFLPA